MRHGQFIYTHIDKHNIEFGKHLCNNGLFTINFLMMLRTDYWKISNQTKRILVKVKCKTKEYEIRVVSNQNLGIIN